jgi:hypothetical protein
MSLPLRINQILFLESLAESPDLTRIEISGKCRFILSQIKGMHKQKITKIEKKI